MATGFVYIMSNPSFNCIKVGQPSKHPSHRAKELYEANTSVPTEFVIEAWVMIEEYDFVERLLHKHLGDARVNESREFFNCTVIKAANTLANILRQQEIVVEAVSTPWPNETAQNKRSYENRTNIIIGITRCPSCKEEREHKIPCDIADDHRLRLKCHECGFWYFESKRDLISRKDQGNQGIF